MVNSPLVKATLLLACLGLLVACAANPTAPGPLPLAQSGVMDLSAWSFEQQGKVALDGDWDFFWKQLLVPPLASGTVHAKLPGYWTVNTELPASGWATYHLVVNLPAGTSVRHTVLALKVTEVLTAFRLWVDEKELFHNGTVGETAEVSRPEYRPGLVFFSPKSDRIEITVQVSNFHYRKGGIWSSFFLGLPQQIEADWYLSSQLNLFLIGGLLIMAIYHFVLWLLRRQERATLYFGLFCLLIVTRVMLTGDQLLSQWMPGFDWELGRRLEFLPLCLGVVVFMFFIRSLYPECVHRPVFGALIAVESLFTAATVLLPVVLSNHLVTGMQVVIVLVLVWVLWVVARAVKQKLTGAKLIVVGSFILVVTIANDMAYADQLVYTGYVMPLGFFVFILLQAILLSVKFTDSYRRSERLFDELQAANASFRRFVPYEFLQNLKRTSTTEIALGDQVQREMTVMFADIRSFTQLAESMTPGQTFNFLNSYLKRMGPIIREHGGFIDKFMGDGLLALFPDRIDAALDAGVAMYHALREYNGHRAQVGYVPVSIGIALNHGSLILGTIGEKDRLETTVISDAVNVASRLEGLCKHYGPGVLLPESLLERLEDRSRYTVRRLDVLRIRGRTEPVALAQVVAGAPDEVVARLTEFLALWERGITDYRAGSLAPALGHFEAARALWPGDVAASLFVQRLQRLLAEPLGEWSPVMDWNVLQATGG